MYEYLDLYWLVSPCPVTLKAISSLLKVQFQQFEHFSVANNGLFLVVGWIEKLFFIQNLAKTWILIHGTSAKIVNLSRKIFLIKVYLVKEFIVSYRKMFVLLKLDHPNKGYD